jgi:phosphoribosyl 1,2-cyclic phosphodiesterase
MKLHIIGTGSKGNCYLFQPEKGKSLIIDCGIHFKDVLKAISFQVSSVAGVLQTHSHGDHSKFTSDFLKKGMKLYMSVDNKAENGIESHNITIIQELKQFEVGDFKVMPFDLKHDVKCLGYLINHPESGKFCFITDTHYCAYTFSGLNNMIVEANYSKVIIDTKYGADSGKEFLRNRILKSHFSLENCIGMLKANDLSNVNNIVLIHLSDSNSDEVDFKHQVQEVTGKQVTVAIKNLEINFNKTPF